jgi:hypothetical protein
MSKLWFMPATPILSNGGTQRGLPISCFLNSVEDSLDGIVGTWTENVWLASNGGGIGTYWGGVRSIGEPVKGNGQTSGIIPFVRVMDSLTLAISQGSLRRGSAAVYLDVHHPENEEFVEIRKPSGDFNRKSLNLHHGINISDAAAAEGAKFIFLATPHRIVGDEGGTVKAIEVVKTRLGEFDSSGRRRPVSTGEIRRLECDTVILAVGEAVDMDFVRASGLRIKDNGTLEVDRYTLETSRSKFYAGGDLISGASNVSNSMGYGKKAARNIDRRLMGINRWSQIAPQFEYECAVPEQPSESPRHHIEELAAPERARTFAEAVVGLSADDALDEASRCLRCDVKEQHA